jgi:hypothetical protein
MAAYRCIILGLLSPLWGKAGIGVLGNRSKPSATFVLPVRDCVTIGKRTGVILSNSEGSAFLPFSCRVGIVFRNQKSQKAYSSSRNLS